ncbi:MAG: cytochrome c peroxidase [Polyangiaceae bacterium]
MTMGGGARLTLLLLVVVAMAACRSEGENKPAPARELPEEPPAQGPITAQATKSIKLATAHATRFKQSCDQGALSREHYLAMRHEIAAAAPFIRRSAEMGSEVLLGPRRSLDEAGGALALLDAALAAEDKAAMEAPLTQILRALRLIDHELVLRPITPKETAQGLSDAAFWLGLGLFEAYPAVPSEPDAVLADLRGAAAGMRRGADALFDLSGKRPATKASHAALSEALASFAKVLGEVSDSHQLTDRASLVKQTARLGVLARDYAVALGVEVKLPYRPRQPLKGGGLDEPVSALTLPAPRVDLRQGDRLQMEALGKKLFFDRRLSQGAQRSCADCHQPDRGYADGLPTPRSLSATPLRRSTPSLLYTSLHAAQLWDGLIASAEQQALKVIHTDAEMGLTEAALMDLLKVDAEYPKLFAAAFEDGLTPANVGRALVAFEVAALVPGTAPIDRFARGEDDALSPAMRRGLDLYAGVARCGRCHVPPLFGGSRPPDFSVPVFASLGMTKGPDSHELDDDPGREKVTKRALDRGVFKTPTLRNVHLTAPYFHHGAFPTLEEALRFYEDGGGRGRGAKVDNLDPDMRKLELSDAARSDLLVFLREALADAAP